ncbi:uncharacterized protein C3orf22 homolog isoform X1 [Eschrichtius robustus]|uniref:uncharacterized protein C3orf22 homolog isoform X1 n=1 Tax=Eschrichtius robustus TaxID=9764 RepID=UPI0035BEE749
MDVKAPKGSHQGKKSKTRTEEKFARKFPYRFSWLTETNAEPLQPWEVTKMSSSLREQLPLQKTSVPTRSIPVRGPMNTKPGTAFSILQKRKQPQRKWVACSCQGEKLGLHLGSLRIQKPGLCPPVRDGVLQPQPSSLPAWLALSQGLVLTSSVTFSGSLASLCQGTVP